MNLKDFQLVLNADKRILQDLPKKSAYGVLDVVAVAYGLMRACDTDPQFMHVLTHGFDIRDYLTVRTEHGFFVRVACDMLMRSTNELFVGIIPAEIEYMCMTGSPKISSFDSDRYWDKLNEFMITQDDINNAIMAGNNIIKLSTYYRVINNTRMSEACDHILYNIWTLNATANDDIGSTKKRVDIEIIANMANKMLLFACLLT